MSSSGFARIEPLNKDNFDSWKMHMQALLVKNDLWSYVSGEFTKPVLARADPNNEAEIKTWLKNDSKAKSDIILCVSASELKQIKNCITSRDVWLKLVNYYQSKGPARKATLLKQLTLQRMNESDDVRDHINKFFDAVDKLNEMEVEINRDLLAIMLLYSLQSSFENFRCAIESRDELPAPDVLRIKIIEENDARKNDVRVETQNAMYSNKHFKKWRHDKKASTKKNENREFKFRCHKCREIGHKAAECRNKNKNRPYAKQINDECLFIADARQTGMFDENTKWCLDSGASSHVCKKLNDFIEIDSNKRGKLNLASNNSTDITGKGTAAFTADVPGDVINISLRGALHVPDLRTNLLSVGKITKNGYEVLFKRNEALVMNKTGNVRLVADRVGDLYYAREIAHTSVRNKRCEMSLEMKNSIHDSAFNSGNATEMLMLWHRRLGHLNVSDIHDMVRRGIICDLDVKQSNKDLECDVCIQGKMTRKPFPKKSGRESSLLEIVHTDVCGPMRVASMGKAKYFVEYIDDYSRWCEVRFIKSKDEVTQITKEVIALMENQKGLKVKCLQSDNGTEYTNNDLDNHLKKLGIVRRLTIPYNPEQNGIAERKNRTLLETARCMLIQANLPPTFWAEAVNTANYIRNRCPTKSLMV